MLKKTFIYFFSISFLFSITNHTEDTDLIEAKSKVNKLKLYQDLQWIKLLYYKKKLLGGYKTLTDGQQFFLHKKGSEDPQKEMIQFLTVINSENKRKVDPKDRIACKFPARYTWLKKKI